MFMKGIKKYLIAGAIFVSILGTVLHFVYEWSGNNLVVGLFTPVNESTWEHTKLLFFPMLIYSLYLERKTEKEYPCIGTSMILGALTGVLSIIALFYTYSGIIGFNVAFVDISIFYISVIIAFYVVYRVAQSCKMDRYKVLWQIVAVVMVCLYILFTIYPPHIALFANPLEM